MMDVMKSSFFGREGMRVKFFGGGKGGRVELAITLAIA